MLIDPFRESRSLMRSNHKSCIGISFVLACLGIGNARAVDCLVAVPDDISQVFARGELDAEAVTERDLSGEFVGPQLRDAVQSEAGARGFVGPMPSLEQQAWGRNLLEEAAEGKFTGQPGVTEYKVGDETYQKIPISLLNRETVIRIALGSGIVKGDAAKPSVTADSPKPLITADPAKPLVTADAGKPLVTTDPAKPGLSTPKVAVSAKTQFSPPSTFWVPPIIVVVVPTFPKEWVEI